jgi:hypothetical protein
MSTDPTDDRRRNFLIALLVALLVLPFFLLSGPLAGELGLGGDIGFLVTVVVRLLFVAALVVAVYLLYRAGDGAE